DIYTNQTVYRNNDPRSAFTQAHMVSPSLSAIYRLLSGCDLFLNFGRGLVTRPARDQAASPHLAPVTVTGAEIGSRYTGFGGSLSLAGSLWWAYKDREYIFDSEFGGSVERGRSHRLGFELELRWAPVRWAWVATDLFLTLTRLQQPQGWSSIPNTPWLLMTNVVGVQHPSGLVASVRGRLLGPRYHDLGLESPAYYVVDLVAGWKWRHVTLVLTIENLFDTVWYDSVFAYPVRVSPEGEVNQGLQVTPGTPFSARLELTVRI
ncbi:MAG: TonB-dependent receptor, partial [Deltaproteobacteria bacterium]